MTVVEVIGVSLLAAFSLGLLRLLKRRLTRRKNRGSTPRPVVYDKAEHHLLDAEIQSREGFNAYLHGGMYLGWIIGSGLHAPECFQGDPSLLERFRARKVTVSDVRPAQHSSWIC